jgi:hypothetical protein
MVHDKGKPIADIQYKREADYQKDPMQKMAVIRGQDDYSMDTVRY